MIRTFPSDYWINSCFWTRGVTRRPAQPLSHPFCCSLSHPSHPSQPLSSFPALPTAPSALAPLHSPLLPLLPSAATRQMSPLEAAASLRSASTRACAFLPKKGRKKSARRCAYSGFLVFFLNNKKKKPPVPLTYFVQANAESGSPDLFHCLHQLPPAAFL